MRKWIAVLLPASILAAISLLVFSTKKAASNIEQPVSDVEKYKPQIVEAMVEKTVFPNGKKLYEFEHFLPKLSRQNNKFQVKVFIGNPPSVEEVKEKYPIIQPSQILQLFAVPEGEPETAIKKGLSKWSDYFDFSYVTNFAEADLKYFLIVIN